MGILDGLLGGVVGAEMATVVNTLIEKHGGVQGIVSQFEQQGLGGTIKSWIADGENQAISPEQIHQVLGSDTIKHLADKFGISTDEMANKISTMLPHAVDQMTPQGQVAAA